MTVSWSCADPEYFLRGGGGGPNSQNSRGGSGPPAPPPPPLSGSAHDGGSLDILLSSIMTLKDNEILVDIVTHFIEKTGRFY